MTEIREAPRELLALAVAMREDWDRDATWNALLAAKHAGWPFERILKETVRLLLRADSDPVELRHAAGDTRALHAAPVLSDEERAALRAEALAACDAASEHIRQQAGEDDAA